MPSVHSFLDDKLITARKAMSFGNLAAGLWKFGNGRGDKYPADYPAALYPLFKEFCTRYPLNKLGEENVIGINQEGGINLQDDKNQISINRFYSNGKYIWKIRGCGKTFRGSTKQVLVDLQALPESLAIKEGATTIIQWFESNKKYFKRKPIRKKKQHVMGYM